LLATPSADPISAVGSRCGDDARRPRVG
jgi:hypothetical protein